MKKNQSERKITITDMRVHTKRINNRLKDAEQIRSLEDEGLEIIQ